MAISPLIAEFGIQVIPEGSGADLSVALGTTRTAANRTGFYSELTPGSERLGVVVGAAECARALADSFQVLPTTASTSSTTGALTVAGGVGVDGDVYIGSRCIIEAGQAIHVAGGVDNTSNAGIHIDGSSQNGAGTMGGIAFVQSSLSDRRLYITGNDTGLTFNWGGYSNDTGGFQLSTAQVAVAAEFRIGKSGTRVMRNGDTNTSLMMNTDTDPGAFIAVADTDGYDTYLRTQGGGAHTLNDPRGGDLIFIPGADGSGGAGRCGRFHIAGAGVASANGEPVLLVEAAGDRTIQGTRTAQPGFAFRHSNEAALIWWLDSVGNVMASVGYSDVSGSEAIWLGHGNNISGPLAGGLKINADNTVTVQSTTASTSSTTGALVVAGGIGFSGDIVNNLNSSHYISNRGLGSYIESNAATTATVQMVLNTAGPVGATTIANTGVRAQAYGTDFTASLGAAVYGYGENRSGSLLDKAVGVYGYCSATFYSSRQGRRYGVVGHVDDNNCATTTTSEHVGVYGYSVSSIEASFPMYGLRGAVVATTTTTTRSIYGAYLSAIGASATDTVYGLYAAVSGAGTSYAGYFDGDVNITGKLTVAGLIDPTGLELTPVASNPGGTAANTLWIDSGSSSWKFGDGSLALDLGASLSRSVVVTVTATGTLTRQSSAKHIVTTSAVTVSLWTTGILDGDEVYIRNRSGGNITIDTAGAETIEGQSSYTMLDDEARMFVYDSATTDWTVF